MRLVANVAVKADFQPVNPTLVFILAGAAILGPMVFRMARPVPKGDLKLIETFLKDRDQTVLDVKKVWTGGPPRYGGRGIYAQTGRPYLVMARSSDRSEWKHYLASVPADDSDGRTLMERSYGGWTRVLL